MPSPFNTQNTEKKILDANNVYLNTYVVRENNSYNYLNNYNFNGSAPMIDYTWTSYSGDLFDFNTLSGGFRMNGNFLGGMTAEDKIKFFRQLPRFVSEVLKNYNQFYGF